MLNRNNISGEMNVTIRVIDTDNENKIIHTENIHNRVTNTFLNGIGRILVNFDNSKTDETVTIPRYLACGYISDVTTQDGDKILDTEKYFPDFADTRLHSELEAIPNYYKRLNIHTYGSVTQDNADIELDLVDEKYKAAEDVMTVRYRTFIGLEHYREKYINELGLFATDGMLPNVTEGGISKPNKRNDTCCARVTLRKAIYKDSSYVLDVNWEIRFISLSQYSRIEDFTLLFDDEDQRRVMTDNVVLLGDNEINLKLVVEGQEKYDIDFVTVSTDNDIIKIKEGTENTLNPILELKHLGRCVIKVVELNSNIEKNYIFRVAQLSE